MQSVLREVASFENNDGPHTAAGTRTALAAAKAAAPAKLVAVADSMNLAIFYPLPTGYVTAGPMPQRLSASPAKRSTGQRRANAHARGSASLQVRILVHCRQGSPSCGPHNDTCGSGQVGDGAA